MRLRERIYEEILKVSPLALILLAFSCDKISVPFRVFKCIYEAFHQDIYGAWKTYNGRFFCQASLVLLAARINVLRTPRTTFERIFENKFYSSCDLLRLRKESYMSIEATLLVTVNAYTLPILFPFPALLHNEGNNCLDMLSSTSVGVKFKAPPLLTIKKQIAKTTLSKLIRYIKKTKSKMHANLSKTADSYSMNITEHRK